MPLPLLWCNSLACKVTRTWHCWAYWIRRGRQGTCMCGRCENTRHGQVACSSNKGLFELAYGTRNEQILVLAAARCCCLKDIAALSLTSSVCAWYLRCWCQQVVLVLPVVVSGGGSALLSVLTQASRFFDSAGFDTATCTSKSWQQQLTRICRVALPGTLWRKRVVLPTDLCTGVGGKKSNLLPAAIALSTGSFEAGARVLWAL